MQKKYKGILICLITILLLGVIVFVGYKIMNKPEAKTQEKHVDLISEYGYSLEKRDTRLMKNIFISLKSELSKSDINYEKYAEYLGKLYIIDLFTIDNKMNKYDIPCLEYLMEESKENFSLNIEDTLYRYVEDNSDSKRKQELPEVKSIVMDKIDKTEYLFNSEKLEAYKVTYSWEYKKDYDYDNKGNVIIAKKDNKLYVVNYDNSLDEVSNEESN